MALFKIIYTPHYMKCTIAKFTIPICIILLYLFLKKNNNNNIFFKKKINLILI